VWVGAAPTGKKAVAMLKRKPSSDEVSTPKGKKAKGGPVVARKYLGHHFWGQNIDVCAAPSSKAQFVVPSKSKSRSKGSLINSIELTRCQIWTLT